MRYVIRYDKDDSVANVLQPFIKEQKQLGV